MSIVKHLVDEMGNHYGGEQEGSWNHIYGDAPV